MYIYNIYLYIYIYAVARYGSNVHQISFDINADTCFKKKHMFAKTIWMSSNTLFLSTPQIGCHQKQRVGGVVGCYLPGHGKRLCLTSGHSGIRCQRSTLIHDDSWFQQILTFDLRHLDVFFWWHSRIAPTVKSPIP